MADQTPTPTPTPAASKTKRYSCIAEGRYAVRSTVGGPKEWKKVRKGDIVPLTDEEFKLNESAFRTI